MSGASVLLFTGKGGVGKSTIAAATAVRASELGLRVHLVSTDPAHSLGDVFGVPIGDAGAVLADNLTVSEPDARVRFEASWAEVRQALASLVSQAGVDSIQAGELTVVPGAEELIALSALVDLAERDDLDLVVVDCAPTAETIRLLSAPQVVTWWLDRLAPTASPWMSMVGPVVEQTIGISLPGPAVMDELRRLVERLVATQNLLTNVERTGVRLVSSPHPVVVAETRRAHTYLSLFGLRVDAAIMNRLLPDAVADPFFDRWRAVEAEQADVLSADLAPVPVWRVPLADSEIVGLDALSVLGRAIYADEDPTARFTTTPTHEWIKPDGVVTLMLHLGVADGRNVDIGRRGDELIVTIGPHRRVVALPDSLATTPVRSARVVDGSVRITFG